MIHHPLMPKRIFISHDLEGTPEAVQFMEILRSVSGSEFSFFLASDRDSLGSGQAWFPSVLEESRNCDEFICSDHLAGNLFASLDQFQRSASWWDESELPKSLSLAPSFPGKKFRDRWRISG